METTTGAVQAGTPGQPHLKRVLGLWDLIYYGVILTSPIAAVPLFGEAQVLSHGHSAATMLLAMVAMSVTAISFGRMAFVYPSAGSVYTYVSRGVNPHLGFVVGWAMFLEYLFQPVQNALYAVLAIQRMAPKIPFAVLALLTVGFITLMTVQGIKFTARTNEVLLGFMVLVTAIFLVEAVRYIVLHDHYSGLFSFKPVYNPATFNLRGLAAGTSLAALVFIGFDGVSILAEEVKNPKRNVLLATVLVVIFTGLFSGLQVYLAQRVWPDYTTMQNPETAFMDVAKQASGPMLFAAYGVMLLVSSIACGLAGHVGAARLLYSMGRDDVLPKEDFWALEPEEKQSDLQHLDRRWVGLHRGADHSVGACGGGGYVWGANRIYGSEPGGDAAFLVFAGSDRETEFLYRCIRAWVWIVVLLYFAAKPAVVDEICGFSVAGRRDIVRGVYDAWI